MGAEAGSPQKSTVTGRMTPYHLPNHFLFPERSSSRSPRISLIFNLQGRPLQARVVLALCSQVGTFQPRKIISPIHFQCPVDVLVQLPAKLSAQPTRWRICRESELALSPPHLSCLKSARCTAV